MKNGIIKNLFLLGLATFIYLGLSFAEDPVDVEYRINENDLIDINVYGERDLSKTLRVATDGKVSFPLIGSVESKGKTAKELEQTIAELLEKDYLVNPQVSVFIREYAKFSILGQIKSPGAYQLKSGLKVMDAIALAGGFTDKANVEDVKLVRDSGGNKETIAVNTKNISEQNSAGANPVLKPGDLVIVGGLTDEGSSFIVVLGQVKKPGRYPYIKDMTVLEAIALAGGLTDTAASNSTRVIREKGDKKETIPVNVASLLRGGSKKDVILEAEDKVIVPESFF